MEKANHPGKLLLYIAAAGLLARLALSAISIGTNDIHSWYRFARTISDQGIFRLYAIDPLFNHPPLMGYLAYLCLQLAEFTGLPFPFCMRFPAILTEVGSVI